MRTILVVGSHPEFAESIRAVLNPEQSRVIHRLDFTEAEPLLSSLLCHRRKNQSQRARRSLSFAIRLATRKPARSRFFWTAKIMAN